MALCRDTQQGRCCQGASCTSRKRCKCVCIGGSFSSGDCAGKVCVASGSYDPNPWACLTNVNACACSATYGGTFYANFTTCDCRYISGACPGRLCQVCNTATGVCSSNCPAPRDCCQTYRLTNAATCCPESQRCVQNPNPGFSDFKFCENKCAAPTTYCRTSLTPYIWSCCQSGQTCCPGFGCCAAGQDCCPTGCATPINGTVTVNVAQDAWVSGPPLTAGQYISITATASGGNNANPGTTVSWASQGSESTPDGVGLCCPFCNIDDTLGHMLLIGRIGGGAWFPVGTSYAGDVPTSGVLQLRQNDTCTGDNQGTYNVSIQIRGCNPAGAASLSADEAIHYSTPDTPPTPTGGPGTELKALLKYVGIVATPNCSCNARAAQMDDMEAREPGWCLANMETILDWLKEQADARRLPFIRSAAKLLVKRAISNAKRKSAREGNSK